MHDGVRARERTDQFAHIGGVRLHEPYSRLLLLRRGAGRVDHFVPVLGEVEADEVADPAAPSGDDYFHGRALLSVASGQWAAGSGRWECNT